jgi:hypothetical protein
VTEVRFAVLMAMFLLVMVFIVLSVVTPLGLPVYTSTPQEYAAAILTAEDKEDPNVSS